MTQTSAKSTLQTRAGGAPWCAGGGVELGRLGLELLGLASLEEDTNRNGSGGERTS